ncbi:MAG: Holliday junction resolvase RuvX [Bacteroidetes bacterium]|nr:Holliday junction resolvase RuvX [Bacteroidota bacterium]MDA1119143.1 Holliday junction resolvase RuvX [Bacteroidota bacterium]
MSRILAIDYGNKRTGLAITDPLRIIATPLETVRTHFLLEYLKEYFTREEVTDIVLGYPTQLDQSETDVTRNVKSLETQLKRIFSDKSIHLHDERLTSKMALEAMITGGMKKKDRRIKGNIDRVSATIILQSYLESIDK